MNTKGQNLVREKGNLTTKQKTRTRRYHNKSVLPLKIVMIDTLIFKVHFRYQVRNNINMNT